MNTIHNAAFLAVADFRYLFRRRETWIWAFVLPLVFFYFIGAITANMSGGAESKDRIAILAPPDAGFLVVHLTQRLNALELETVNVNDERELAKYRRQLTIPPGFTESILKGHPVTVTLVSGGSGLDSNYDGVRVKRAVDAVLADLVIAGNNVTPGKLKQIAAEPNPVTLDVQTAGKRREIPTGFEQSVPGSMVFFILLVLFTTGGITLLLEREQGILVRLASSPMSRTAVLLGKFSSRMMLGGIQIAFALIAGKVLFNVHWGPNLPMVIVVLIAFASFAAATGILVGNFAKTRGQAAAIGSLSANLMSAIGGCWWPAEIMPPWMQSTAKLTPSGLTMDALHKLINFGDPISAVFPHLIALTIGAAIAGVLVARSFRFQ